MARPESRTAINISALLPEDPTNLAAVESAINLVGKVKLPYLKPILHEYPSGLYEQDSFRPPLQPPPEPSSTFPDQK